jgi:hypothetical protein
VQDGLNIFYEAYVHGYILMYAYGYLYV